MDLLMQHEAFARGRTAVARAADDLHSHRSAIDARVSALVGASWTGDAARSFDEAWGEWRAGAQEVADGLAAMSDLLGAVQRDLRARDEASRQTLGRVSARLVGRLG